ncbi:toll/interleukin-1 receptor domain-containing protein [Priestia megaterium]|uniref:toll/interleukin-1 receptor domain-containing protein n=1 Tax=Priestia megaterium TaxID=1404 RepID=UPI0035BE6B6D
MNKRHFLLVIQVIALGLIFIKLIDSSSIIDSLSWKDIFSMVSGIVAGVIFGVVFSTLFRNFIKKKPNVYISYNFVDKEFVYQLKQELSNLNIKLVEDLVSVGENIATGMIKGIKDADYVIVLISNEYNSSEYCNIELDAAISQKKKIVPIVIDEAEMPKQLDGVLYLRFNKQNYKESVNELIKSLNKIHKKSSK